MLIRKTHSLLLTALLAVAFSITTFAAPIRTMAATAAHKNWVQRHPTMTGIGAGIATHHALKVAAARDKRSGKKLNWAERHPTLSGMGVGLGTRHIIKKRTP